MRWMLVPYMKRWIAIAAALFAGIAPAEALAAGGALALVPVAALAVGFCIALTVTNVMPVANIALGAAYLLLGACGNE
jgi:hypothetical protein